MVKLFSKIVNKNFWLSTFCIVIGILFLGGMVSDLIIKYLHLSKGLILDFLSLLIIVSLIKLISEEIFQVNV